MTESAPNITEGKKHYIFSATENIMIASTDVVGADFSKDLLTALYCS